MLSVSKTISLQKKRIRILERMILLTPLLLIILIRSNNFPLTRLIKRIKTTKEVFGTMIKKDKFEAKTLLQQVLILLSKRKNKTSPILNVFFVKKKIIALASVLKKKSQKQILILATITVSRKKASKYLEINLILVPYI